MADYVSALNGQQMDAALTEVALYNPEAWAVGQRNGVPVTSADETYHNNAKYYAQVAQSAIPGTYTAAVRWDIAQGLEGEAQEQARANISAGASNRNLLDNPWFTVNQRNVAVGTNINGNGFVADRWQATGTTGATRNSDGSLTITDTLFNKLPPALELDGKTVTLSVLYADGTIEANTFPWSGTGTRYFTYGRAVVYASAYQINFISFTKNVKAFKLELGSYSTLANDVPPDYGEELLKCMRYFIRIKGDSIGSGYVTKELNQAYIHIPTPVPMRTAPTAFINESMYIRGTGATWKVSTVSVPTGLQPTNGVSVIAAVNASQVMAVSAYMSSANSYIDLFADL